MPRFNFDKPFLDEKSDFEILNFQSFGNFAKIDDFSKNSQGFNIQGRGLCFCILTIYI